jgi:hypothetical protein
MHELGHLLGQMHIKAYSDNWIMRAVCNVDGNIDPCYGNDHPVPAKGTDPSFWNVMGTGDRLSEVNAISWTKRMELHTGFPADSWGVKMDTGHAPRMVPLATVKSSVGAPVPAF